MFTKKINKLLRFYFCATLLGFVFHFLTTYNFNVNEENYYYKNCSTIIYSDINFRADQCLQNEFAKTDCSHCNGTRLKVTFESINHLRRSYTTAQELFNYLSITLNKTNDLNETFKNTILEEVSGIKNVLQLEIEKASKLLKIDELKNLKLREISRKIQSKIYELQNPPKEFCSKVRKYTCYLSTAGGFATGIHKILWCLLSAYYENRTMILIPDWNRYFSDEKWDQIFKPLSSTCSEIDIESDQIDENEQTNDVFKRKLLNYLPKSIGPELINLLDSPNSWFHSQFISYIMRPQKRLVTHLENFKQKIGYKNPIVGIQIRRSDKLSYEEALYYPLSDYMIHVKDYFDKQDLTETVSQRLVYVASDDPSVFSDLIKEYPNYEFIGSHSISKTASSKNTRYSNSSLWGILTDIFMLSDSDYIVCTFSSAVCRLSYELMRFKQIDASFKYRSLDVPFHYHHSLTPIRTALYNHSPKSANQWSLKIGDHLYERIRKGSKTEWFDQAIDGKAWNSYFYASNSPIYQRYYKLYPYYKVFDDITLV